jgi:hypothetical protein
LIRLTGAGAGEGLAALLDAPSDEQVRGVCVFRPIVTADSV